MTFWAGSAAPAGYADASHSVSHSHGAGGGEARTREKPAHRRALSGQLSRTGMRLSGSLTLTRRYGCFAMHFLAAALKSCSLIKSHVMHKSQKYTHRPKYPGSPLFLGQFPIVILSMMIYLLLIYSNFVLGAVGFKSLDVYCHR